jgi:hypothetical protein
MTKRDQRVMEVLLTLAIGAIVLFATFSIAH